MNRKNSLRLIRRLGLALAVMAIAAPAAQAMPVIDQEGGPAVAPQAFYPDDLHASVPHTSLQSLTYPDDMIRPVSSRPLGPGIVQATSKVSSTSDSSWFDPTHIGLGLFAIGLMLFGGAALIISRQNRRSRLAAA